MSESASTMWVCGEIGYALTTSGRQRATARATACEPSSCSRTDDAPFTDGGGGRERGGAVRGAPPPPPPPPRDAPADRVRDRLARDGAGQRREPAEQRRVRQRPAE